MKSKTTESRLYWVDNLRALAMISMILYHTMWDLVYIYGMRADWYGSTAAFIWQQSICWTFILLSGFCSMMSQNTLKNGLLVSFWGIVIMLVTNLFMPENSIWFGVLTLIGACNMLMTFLKKYIVQTAPELGMTVFFLLFILTYDVQIGYMGILGKKILQLPQVLYQNYATAFLGFPTANFYSTDYFPIIPWLFLFLTGACMCQVYQKHNLKPMKYINVKIPLLSQISRYSLIVYVLHQPIIYGILELIF